MQQSSSLLHVDEQIKKALHLPQSTTINCSNKPNQTHASGGTQMYTQTRWLRHKKMIACTCMPIHKKQRECNVNIFTAAVLQQSPGCASLTCKQVYYCTVCELLSDNQYSIAAQKELHSHHQENTIHNLTVMMHP